MSGHFSGVIIEESLADKEVLKKVKIISTKVVPVTKRHATPWLKQWTMHVVEVESNKMEHIAKEISKSLENEHPWYSDFRGAVLHYIIFRGKIFVVDRASKEEYEKVTKYGISIGIPDYQVSFSPLEQ